MRIDRLAALVGSISVVQVTPHPQPGPVFWVEADGTGLTLGLGQTAPGAVLVAAALSWEGSDVVLENGPFRLCLGQDDPLGSLARLLTEEAGSPRCGSVSLLAGYVEVLMIHLLRDVIGRVSARTGLLGGLADPRLARALVAIHETPARMWNAGSLAETAGMSRSVFMERFRAVVGETPMAYLRIWRMRGAAEALTRGDRVGEVARHYGYRSADAFSRAFQAHHGIGPADWRRRQDAQAA